MILSGATERVIESYLSSELTFFAVSFRTFERILFFYNTDPVSQGFRTKVLSINERTCGNVQIQCGPE
jgi:hypothetical protein